MNKTPVGDGLWTSNLWRNINLRVFTNNYLGLLPESTNRGFL